MRICFVAEGCYPYAVGGVSSWIDSMIKSFPNAEIVLMTVVADRSLRGEFAYQLPDNVTEVYEVYLTDFDWSHSRRGSRRMLSEAEYAGLRSLVLNLQCDWDLIFDLFRRDDLSVDSLLMGEDFLRIVEELYYKRFPEIVFSDFLWTMRSIYLPLFLVLKAELPKADIYHCVATGYAGVLGCLAKHLYGCGLIVSEHGIYTREREEELIKATWVQNTYKNIWIDQFYRMSQVAYDRADLVTCLYGHAKELQIELGCSPDKIRITPNGIRTERFKDIPGKRAEDEGHINVGAVARVTAIKDIKTMIQAYYEARQRVPELKLWIMGPTDDEPEYAAECFELAELLDLKDLVFTGTVNVTEYLGRMDFTILTSISEGQPLTILESFAAHRPVIATDVGNCRGLIYGEEGDEFGPAGILTHVMGINELAQAMVDMALDPEMTRAMGEAGYKRVMRGYKSEDMIATYEDIYRTLAAQLDIPWPEQPFTLELSGTDDQRK